MTSSNTSSYDIMQWHQACIMLSGLQGFYNQAYNSLHLMKTCCLLPKKVLEQKERSWERSQN